MNIKHCASEQYHSSMQLTCVILVQFFLHLSLTRRCQCRLTTIVGRLSSTNASDKMPCDTAHFFTLADIYDTRNSPPKQLVYLAQHAQGETTISQLML